MNKIEWQTCLQSQQAQFSEPDPFLVKSFSRANGKSTTFITPLLYQGFLSIVGTDSAKFLQGQLTCDINNSSPEQSILGVACSPQGRIFSSFRVFQNHDKSGYLLRMRRDLINKTLETIHKYSVFFKTELSNAEDEWLGLGIWGANCDSLISQAFNIKNLPQQVGQSLSTESLILVRMPGNTPRYECWLKSTTIIEKWDTLIQQAQPTSNYPWLQQDIEAGVAEVSQAIEGDFNPHMLNFQLVDAISFDKGCYTGQEIVARTHYRGKSKRLMKRFELAGGSLLTPGIELCDATTEKTVATVICAAPTSDTGTHQEALLLVNAELNTDINLNLSNGNEKLQASELPLPYHFN